MGIFRRFKKEDCPVQQRRERFMKLFVLLFLLFDALLGNYLLLETKTEATKKALNESGVDYMANGYEESIKRPKLRNLSKTNSRDEEHLTSDGVITSSNVDGATPVVVTNSS